MKEQSQQTVVTDLLATKDVEFVVHTFEYLPGGGTGRSSGALGIDEHQVVKTLVFQTDAKQPLIVLMHGDMRVDAKALAKIVSAKKISSCAPEIAEEWSGWPVGSTNPFVLKNQIPIYAEQTIFDCPKIWINGGGRGVLVEIDPRDLDRVVQPHKILVGTLRPQ